MVVKKGNLDQFLNVASLYSDNKKSLRSIFIDKDDEKINEPDNFLESSLNSKHIGTQLEHNKDTSGTQYIINKANNINENHHSNIEIGTQKEHVKDTIGIHQEHNKNTSETQLEHTKAIKNTIRTHQEHVKEHTKGHIRNTIGTQNKDSTATYEISSLAGIQKQLLLLFYLSCKKKRSQITEEFSLHYVADTLKIRLGSVKTSLRRLEEKQFIKCVSFKKGRGGWTKFELPDTVYRELLENEKDYNWNTIGTQLEHKTDTYRNTEKDTNPSSSSSSSILKETTTTKQLGDEWNFDIHAYAHIGFTLTQIKQLALTEAISATDVEQSLVEFSYDLENNALPHIKTSKVNFLMGLLRKGQAYVSHGYQDEMNKAAIEMQTRYEQRQFERHRLAVLTWFDQLDESGKTALEKAMPIYLRVRYNASGIFDEQVLVWLKENYTNQLMNYEVLRET